MVIVIPCSKCVTIQYAAELVSLVQNSLHTSYMCQSITLNRLVTGIGIVRTCQGWLVPHLVVWFSIWTFREFSILFNSVVYTKLYTLNKILILTHRIFLILNRQVQPWYSLYKVHSYKKERVYSISLVSQGATAY